MDKCKVVDTPMALGSKVYMVPFIRIMKKKDVKLYYDWK
jgi:hypothetical protein